MTSAMMMERMGMGMSMPGMGMGPMTAPAAPSMMMVPRCTMKVEKCTGGLKIDCSCDDPMGCSTLQNLCQMLAGGMCSCCCLMNGMIVCSCNLMMGLCKCGMTKQGCTMTVTSRDKACCDMTQSCCDCRAAMMKAGCTCCVMLNGTPVCCGG